MTQEPSGPGPRLLLLGTSGKEREQLVWNPSMNVYYGFTAASYVEP